MIAKVAGGIIGLGLISAGGIAMAKPHWLGMDYMPTFHALSKDHDFANSGYDAPKLGNKYKNYLVGVTNKTKDKNETSNKSWWEWSFRQLEKKKPDKGKFSKITKDYETSGSASLNQICKEAYGKQESDLKGDDAQDTDFTKSDFWKYCSPLGKEPQKVASNSYNTKLGSTSDANFASVDKGVNEMFWTIREKEVRGGDDNFEKINITDASSHTYFNNTKPLKELCEKAYKQPTTGGDSNQLNPDANAAKKYCAISISQS